LLLLEVKECGELQIFDDGRVVESREGKKTERKLSAGQLRKLRKVIERGPCEELWRQTPGKYEPGDLQPLPTLIVPTSNPDCHGAFRGAPFGLREVLVNRHYPDHQTGFSPVYILCETAKASNKKYARRSLKKNSRWPRFFSDVESALGGTGIFKCKCED
jgi:hypothetical protein